MGEQQDGARPETSVLRSLRDGWHQLGGGDAAACPGCPVCRLADSTTGLDPATGGHLQSALGHVLAAGRELLTALDTATRSRPGPGPAPAGAEAAAADQAGQEPGWAAGDAGTTRTRIHVSSEDDAGTGTPRPATNEEQS